MATELAKVSLWINSCVEDMPLNFLDHHIKFGNSLIGATTELLKAGIPEDAFSPVDGDDKKLAKKIMSQNLFERKYKLLIEYKSEEQIKQAKRYAQLDEFVEKSTADVEAKKSQYKELRSSSTWTHQKLLADAWTAAFFWPINDKSPSPPTQATFRAMEQNESGRLTPDFAKIIRDSSNHHHFFHWYLEFPDVFQSPRKGFDCMLGNPPWERIKLQEKEFFQIKSSEIANAPTAFRRKELISELRETNPALWLDYFNSLRDGELEAKFLRTSGRYPLTSKGDINTYSIFSEHFLKTTSLKGLAGIIAPTGLATDNSNKEFFSYVVDHNLISSLIDFENKEGLFAGTHRSFKFSLFTLGSLNEDQPPIFSFSHKPRPTWR